MSILCHYGTKGMKWGVRNYQNPDGSLKPAGYGRYYQRKTPEKVERTELSSGKGDISGKTFDKWARGKNFEVGTFLAGAGSKYIQGLGSKEKGSASKEQLDEILAKQLDGFTYELTQEKRKKVSEYVLKVFGDKYYYEARTEGDTFIGDFHKKKEEKTA